MTTAKTASAQTAEAGAVADAAPTVDAAPAPHVIEALRRVMRDLPGIGKDQTSSAAQGGYAYRGIEQITPHTQVLFAKHGVVFAPRVVRWEIRDLIVNGKPWMDVIEEVEYDVYGPGGIEDKIVVGPLLAIGRDNSDKGGTKCLTQAYKYALLQALSISDAKDDADGQTHEADARSEPSSTGAVSGADLVKAGLATLEPDLQEKLRADVVTRSGLASFDEAMTREDWRKWLTEAIVFYRDKAAPANGPKTARDGQTGVGAPDGAGGAPTANATGLVAGQGYTAEALTLAVADVSEMSVTEVEEILVGWDGAEVSGDEGKDRAALAALFAARAST